MTIDLKNAKTTMENIVLQERKERRKRQEKLEEYREVLTLIKEDEYEGDQEDIVRDLSRKGYVEKTKDDLNDGWSCTDLGLDFLDDYELKFRDGISLFREPAEEEGRCNYCGGNKSSCNCR